MASDLSWIEGLLYRLITAPSGVAEGLAQEKSLGEGDLGTIIDGDDRLTATERLDIYANMYFYRIFDVLREDFPATLAVLGADRFHNLVTGYLIEYPPAHFSIAYAGAQIADFLRDHPLSEEFPFLADLARLERALIDVFHGRNAVALEAEQMRAIPPQDWSSLNLELHPASRMLECDWDVASTLKTVEEGGEPPPPPQRPSTLLIWRNRNRVFYRAVDSVERAALDELVSGASFGEICEAIACAAEVEDVALAINRQLEIWLRDGLLVRV